MGCYPSTGQGARRRADSKIPENRAELPLSKIRTQASTSAARTNVPNVRLDVHRQHTAVQVSPNHLSTSDDKKASQPSENSRQTKPGSGNGTVIRGTQPSIASLQTYSGTKKVTTTKGVAGDSPLQDLTPRVKIGERKASGGFSDVYEGTLVRMEKGNATQIAVKQFRVFDADKKAVLQELSVWASFRHENILPLLGYTSAEGFRLPALITEFMENGSLTDYIGKHPDSDLMRMASGIANGLAYMHSKDIVHADLKPGNIVISAKGTPLITDVGIAKLKERINALTVSGLHGNDRFMAIELLFPGDYASDLHPGISSSNQLTQNAILPIHTKSSDVWSFAMITYQLLSGMVPYYEIAMLAHLHVALYLNRERRPTKPENMASSPQGQTKVRLWELCETCWKTSPSERPCMKDVCTKLTSR